MSGVDLWADAICFSGAGDMLRASLLRHIRDAVAEAGFVNRGRITNGIKEGFRPLQVEEGALRIEIDAAISLLMQTGDIGELSTSAGRAYAATPPRRIYWGGVTEAVLGAVDLSSSATVRRVPVDNVDGEGVRTPLLAELGRPGWRNALVELGGADQPLGDATALSNYVHSLTSAGERYSLDDRDSFAILSGSGEFFGSPDDLSGRWTRTTQEGFYPATVVSGFSKRRVLLMIADGSATLWEPATVDVWNWIVVGVTLSKGEPVWSYNRDTGTFAFLTPPPRQAERAALLTGDRLGAWSWRIDPSAQAMIGSMLGSTRP